MRFFGVKCSLGGDMFLMMCVHVRGRHCFLYFYVSCFIYVYVLVSQTMIHWL